jgi:hypothetical protein
MAGICDGAKPRAEAPKSNHTTLVQLGSKL